MSTVEIQEGTKYYPSVVALEVTLHCNLRCIHCGSSAANQPRQKELTLDQWKNVVDQLAHLNSSYITLSGGEPFLWPPWRKISRYVRDKNINLAIISNGYRIADADIDYLKNIGLHNIALSVDGMRNTHNNIRGKKDCYDSVISAIKRFRKAGIKIAVVTSVNKLNFDELEPVKQYINDCGADIWQVQIVNSFGRAGEQKDKLLIDSDQYLQLVEFIYSSQQEVKKGKLKTKVMPADSIGYCYGIASEIWGDLKWSGCNAGRYVLGIQSNGDVVGCLSLQGKEFIGGNILERPLDEIWNDDDAFAYNRNFDTNKLKGACKGCSAGEQCRSGCLAMGYSTTRELHNNPHCYMHLKETAPEPAATLDRFSQSNKKLNREAL